MSEQPIGFLQRSRRRGHSVWLHRYAVLVAGATLVLIAVGGMVTSTGSGLAVPDWPTTFGHNMFTYPWSKWVGGVFYEHGHRIVASIVGFMTIILAVWLHVTEPRPRVRRVGWIALALVCIQGVLGGLAVRFLLPAPISVMHACLAQNFFCITVAIAVVTSPQWLRTTTVPRAPTGGLTRILCLAATAAVFVQLVLGAIMRHNDAGLAVPDFPLAYGEVLPSLSAGAVDQYNHVRAWDYMLPAVEARQIGIHMAHRVWSLVVVALIIFAAGHLLRRHAAVTGLRRPSVLVMIMVLAQIALGAWTVWSGKTPVIATAHVALGAVT